MQRYRLRVQFPAVLEIESACHDVPGPGVKRGLGDRLPAAVAQVRHRLPRCVPQVVRAALFAPSRVSRRCRRRQRRLVCMLRWPRRCQRGCARRRRRCGDTVPATTWFPPLPKLQQRRSKKKQAYRRMF
jgi:hypothetical protein